MEGVLGGVVVFFADGVLFKGEFFVEGDGGGVGGADFQKKTVYALLFASGEHILHEQGAYALPAKIGADGDVVYVALLEAAVQAVIADDFTAAKRNSGDGVGGACQSGERTYRPGRGKSLALYLVEGGSVGRLHIAEGDFGVSAMVSFSCLFVL